MRHMDTHRILSDAQHGFRKKRSTDSQLILSIQDLAQTLDASGQVDCILLDLSKAFDKVPHKRLLLKAHHYGIDGRLHSWIASFLRDRSQQVALEGTTSAPAPVTSGVPQGTVLGPLLFLIFINDMPTKVSSTPRLFADDCLLYRQIRSDQDQRLLQQDLDSLQKWEEDWLMQFNPDKCEVLRVTNKRAPLVCDYTIHGQKLQSTDAAKYLGLNIQSNLKWNTHIDSVCKRANSTIAFLQRNIKRCPTNIKAQCYIQLVRPAAEYASSVWSPPTKAGINKIEAIQRRAARFVMGDYRRTSSVTAMIKNLQWQSLEARRKTAQVTMLYRIANALVAIPTAPFLQPSNLRTRGHHLRYMVPPTRTTVYQASFFPQAIRLWNSLPASVAAAPTLDDFKSQMSRVTFQR